METAPSCGDAQARAALREALTKAAAELAAVDHEFAVRRKRELRSWEDEEPALQVYASAMAQTADVMRAELDKLRSDLHAAFQSAGGIHTASRKSHADSAAVSELAVEIERLVQHIESIDKQMQECRRSLGSAQHVEDRALWETQLVALQDTKNLTVAELERLRVELTLKQRDAAFKQQHQSGQAKIKQLQDELSSTVSKVDRVKQLIHFPAVEGFRFRSGSGGVFLGSKDLFVSELTASFHLSCKRAIGKEGRPRATISIKLGGEPPRMSFSAHMPSAARAPSAFTASPSRTQSGSFKAPPQPAGARPSGVPVQATPAQVARLKGGPAPSRYAQRGSGSRSSGIAPLEDTMVPSEAPKQGVWFDRASFDAATSAARDAPSAANGSGSSGPGRAYRRAGGVGESTEGQTEDLISFDDDRASGLAETVSLPVASSSNQGCPPGDAGDLLSADSGAFEAHTMPLPSLEGRPTMSSTQGSAFASSVRRTSSLGEGIPAPHDMQRVDAGSRRAVMKQKAGAMASALATRGSKSKQAAVGLLNKLSQSKRFGKREGGDESGPLPPPTDIRRQVSGDYMPDDGASGSDATSLRSKLVSASKKGVANVGAFVKTHGKQASVVVGNTVAKQATAAVGRMQKLRHAASPQNSQPGTPTFLEALSADHISEAPSTTLPEFTPQKASEGSPSRTQSGVADPAALASPLSAETPGSATTRSEFPAMELPRPVADGTPQRKSGSARVVHESPSDEYVHVQSADAARAEPVPAGSGPGSVSGSSTGGERASRPSDYGAGVPAAAASAPGPSAFAAEPRRERKGVFLRVQATDVKVVGEKGTKIPNFTVNELALLLECTMEAAFEWTELDGWRPMHKLKLNIDELEHSISGTNIPVPKTLLKYLLNLMLPALIEARLLAVLPAEIGQYFIDADTPGIQLGGKLQLIGPSLSALNADLATDPATQPVQGSKSKKAQHSAAASAAARSNLELTLAQCSTMADLLCSQHSCVLPRKLGSLTISHLCHLLAPLSNHPDLLARWKAAVHDAIVALCAYRNIPPVNWRHVSENVLEPSIRKPLRLKFLITCLDLSWNVNAVIAAGHDYFTRAAQAEASRMPAGSTLLADQLQALNELHKYLVEWTQTFRRRFRHARGSLLASLDSSSLKAILENVHYQGPMKVELPFGEYSKVNGKNISFDVALPTAAFSEGKHSVLRNALRVLLGDAAAADRKYWARTIVKGPRRSSQTTQDNGAAGNGSHLLQLGSDTLGTAEEGDKVAIGTVEVCDLSFKLQLDDRLLEHMLGASGGTMTDDSLGRVLQCFGPCMQLNVGSHAVQQQPTAADKAAGNNKPKTVSGMVLSTGEVCNACLTANELAFSSVIPPLRVIRLLHTMSVAFQQQQQQKHKGSANLARLDAFFHSLARYVGSAALDMTMSLQLGLTAADNSLLLQLVGSAPKVAKGSEAHASSCCISITNEMDMATVLDSIDLSQGAPVERT